MADDQGASPTQVLLAAARSNNLELLRSCIESTNAPDLNATDSVGNSALHNAARYGSLECLDFLLDQESIDLDQQNRMEGDTPLHAAIRHSREDPAMALETGMLVIIPSRNPYGLTYFSLVEFLIDAGADTEIKNRHGDRPLDLVDPENQPLKDALMKANLADMMTGDVVGLDELDEDVVSDGESD